VIKHFYYWYKKKYLKKIDLLIHLRPTTPFRKVSTILNAIKIMKKNKNFDSLRSFVESDFPGFKLWLRDNDSAQLLVKSNKNYHSMGRQFIPKTFCHVGYIDILIFDNRCPHRSNKNISNNMRRILYYTYSLSSAGSQYKKYFHDKKNSKNANKSLTGDA
jgi:CMP-N-acetylneuraminic acid synthetase